MPLFEVDATRPFLVQSPGNGTSGEPGVHTSAHRVVESHIDGLLGEQVFPVAQGSGPDEPHLLALDASGLPVVVELVGDLDKSTLTLALDHAGAAGRLTRGELASRYHGGQHRFAHDVADFYDSVPITQSSSSKSGGGARLIIICQNAPQEILNAVDFLRQPTMPVEVLKMDVVKSDDGRRFLDVSPLVIHLPPGLPSPRQADRDSITRGNAPEHVTPEPVASAPMFTSQSQQADNDPFAEGVKVGYALTGKMPAVARDSRAEARHPSVPPADAPESPLSGPTAAPLSGSEQGTNPARGLRRSLTRSGATPSAPEGTPSADSSRTLPPSRSARRAMAEREAAAPSSQPTPAPLSPERPGWDTQPSAPTPMPGPPPATAEDSDPSAPSSDTLPRVPKPAPAPAPARRRSRRDRFSSAPDEQVETPADTPAPDPLLADDALAFAGETFTSHSPVPPPPTPEIPASGMPAPPAENDLWQPSTYTDADYSTATPVAGTEYFTPIPPAAPQPSYAALDEGQPNGAFEPIDSTPFDSVPFEPPVIDSQWPEPGYPQAAGYSQAAGYGQEVAYAAAPGQEQVYDWSADPSFGATPSGLAAQPDYFPAPDAHAGYQAPAPDAQEHYFPGTPDPQGAFPGHAPEAQIPPVPTDESIRANTPGLFDEEEDPDLEALARSFGAPTRIVWSRPRRNQHYEATLHPNGVIELADGGQYRHPDTAATAASGSYTADGWSVWRVGEQGPSLTEAFQQRFV